MIKVGLISFFWDYYRGFEEREVVFFFCKLRGLDVGSNFVFKE